MTRWKNWKVEINQPPWSHDHSHLVTPDRLLETIRECGARLTHYDNLCGVGGGNNELKGKVHKEVQPSINLHITDNLSDISFSLGPRAADLNSCWPGWGQMCSKYLCFL